jgi:predicted enzyme related to lactoylglutathione lyase
MDKVVHFEIPVDQLDRAKDFYGSVFGWQLHTMSMGEGGDYTIAMTTPVDEQTQVPTDAGAINGGLMTRTSDLPAPVITIGVDAIDDALQQVEANGGTTLTPRTAIEGMGAFAYFTDPEGNVMGLWETAGG